MKKAKKHQAMVEYIIIVAIIAIGSLTVFGFFGQTIVEKVSGIVSALGGSKADQAQEQAGRDGSETLKGLGADGLSD